MKLQKLTIHNIASIEDAVIDFEKQPLSDSEVFLITGQTGSGKSTILDAICLALYADTPRLDNTKMEGESQDNEGTLKINDPRQLLRRDAVEGWVRLTFIGNNGVRYQAEWEVQRAYKKVTGNMKKAQWTLQVLPDGPLLIKVKEIQQEIAKAIELDFPQFCRTTLLAQGDFTRFLNSKDAEKAAILEKLTGMDVYAKIGQQVYEETGKKKKDWQNAQNLTKGITTLNDEQLAEKKQELAEKEKSSTIITQARDQAKEKKQWLETEVELGKKVAKALDEYNEIKDSIKTEEFKRQEKTVQEWHDTIEARRYLYEKNDAVKEEKKQLSLLNNLKKEQGTLQDKFEEVKANKKKADSNVEKQEESIKEKEKELENLHMEQLRDQWNATTALQNSIEQARILLKTLDDARKLRVKKEQDIVKRKKEISKKKKDLDKLDAPLHDAEVKKNTAKQLYDAQKDTIDKFASALRQKLQIGDVCPVCQQKISSALPHEEELKKIVDNLQEAFTTAEKEYNALMDDKNKLEAEIKSEQHNIHDAQSDYDNDDSVENAETNALEQLQKCKIETISEDSNAQLDILEDQQKKILKELGKKIKIGEDIENVLRHDLRPTLDKLRKEADNQRKAYEKANDDIKEIDRQKKTAEDRLEEAQKQIRGNNASLVAFLAQHPEMNETKLSELDKFTLESISKTRNEIAEQKDQVETRKTTWKIESDNLNKHLKTKPEMMEEDTLTNLGKRIADYEEEDKTINQQIGALNNDLEKDEENRQKLGQRKEEENAAKKEFDKWERLNQLIGSADGKKFREIALSYVLGSLIHSANSYMRTLTDRYTLKVSPGTFVILVEDAYQGFATRAASTISGGESFLVSLSLALALSDIGQKLSVNTLFIDEGFGTLSGEPLQNAITTLRTLHDKSGRHVGIISHIEELKERIPVQIQVNQASGSSSSTIKIVP